MRNQSNVTKRGQGRISTRFRNINALFFALLLLLISIAMLLIIQGITDTVSRDYARLYAANTVGTLDTYFGSQIALVKKAARSNVVIEWFDDEDNPEKKVAAYDEMMEIIDSLPSKNLYIGIEKSLHEFTVEEGFAVDDIQSFATLEHGYFDDAWYFECTSSQKDYQLNVDIDKIMQRKRVWLNYKVERDGRVYGALCTWLEFSELVEQLFAEYDDKNVRGLVVDEHGMIQMDSSLLGDDNFLHYSIGDERRMDEEFTDTAFLSAVDAYLREIDGYFDLFSPTIVVRPDSGRYRYATIAPIASSTWSVITLYNADSLFSAFEFIPILIIVFAMFVAFIIATGIMSSKLIFGPLDRLTRSIARMKVNTRERVYGMERRDEIGEIARTIQDMKDSLIDALDKVHYDALTGIYNRRYFEESLDRIFKTLSRSNGLLSVMMIDVDFFKNYNDAYGHDEGDACLKLIAGTFVSSIGRGDDFVARYGGEEFIVVLPNTGEGGARIMADKLLENLRARNIPHSGNEAAECVTVSIGVTTGRVTHAQSRGDYVRQADIALYASKHSGRNKYTFIGIDEAVKGEEL